MRVPLSSADAALFWWRRGAGFSHIARSGCARRNLDLSYGTACKHADVRDI